MHTYMYINCGPCDHGRLVTWPRQISHVHKDCFHLVCMDFIVCTDVLKYDECVWSPRNIRHEHDTAIRIIIEGCETASNGFSTGKPLSWNWRSIIMRKAVPVCFSKFASKLRQQFFSSCAHAVYVLNRTCAKSIVHEQISARIVWFPSWTSRVQCGLVRIERLRRGDGDSLRRAPCIHMLDADTMLCMYSHTYCLDTFFLVHVSHTRILDAFNIFRKLNHSVHSDSFMHVFVVLFSHGRWLLKIRRPERVYSAQGISFLFVINISVHEKFFFFFVFTSMIKIIFCKASPHYLHMTSLRSACPYTTLTMDTLTDTIFLLDWFGAYFLRQIWQHDTPICTKAC